MTETWPTLDDEPWVFLVSESKAGREAVVRALLHRIRQLEAVIDKGECDRLEAALDGICNPYTPPLTKSMIEAAAEKLFQNEGRRTGPSPMSSTCYAPS